MKKFIPSLLVFSLVLGSSFMNISAPIARAQSADVQIIDDGDAGFTTVGTWLHSNGGGAQNFESDRHYLPAGDGSNTAQWTFTATPGTYRVSATWLARSNRADNVPVTIQDGSNTVLSTTLNQELVPDDLQDAGAFWEDVGTVTVSSNSLSVMMTDGGNQYVIADAVRIEKIQSNEFMDDANIKIEYLNPQGEGEGEDISIIDAMVLYTPQALAESGLSAAEFEKKVQQRIDCDPLFNNENDCEIFSDGDDSTMIETSLNGVLEGSQVNARVNLVHIQQISHNDSENDEDENGDDIIGSGIIKDINFVRNDSTINALRDKHYADIVILIIGLETSPPPPDAATNSPVREDILPNSLDTLDPNNASDIDLLQRNKYVSVVRYRSFAGNYALTFFHEFGHLLGAGHEAGQQTYHVLEDSAQAHFDLGNFETLMIAHRVDYCPGRSCVLPFYSNNNILIEFPTINGTLVSIPMGIAGERTNYATMNKMAKVVAKYRIQPPSTWTNPSFCLDVGNDGFVTSQNDALKIINFLNNYGPMAVADIPANLSPETSGYLDAGNDGFVTSQNDALKIINFLNNYGPMAVADIPTSLKDQLCN